MNITLSHQTALSMDSTVITIDALKFSYNDLIIYGLFSLLIFIGLIVWIMVFKRGG